MKYFADRKKITFPLLSDPDSKTIRAYDVLNAEAAGPYTGMARPGFFYIDRDGIIKEKFFQVKYRERLSGNNLIARLFPELGSEVTDKVDAPHLQLSLEQSDPSGVPGERITLAAAIRLPADVHVYAPGAKGYKPVALQIEPPPELQLKPAVYPRAKILYLPAIKERVPVFEGEFRISQDVQINSAAEFSSGLAPEGRTFTIIGKLQYQACDAKICYLPASVPVKWQLVVMPLDRQRAPEDIRHK